MYQLHSAIGQDQRQLFLYKITIPALASQNPTMYVISQRFLRLRLYFFNFSFFTFYLTAVLKVPSTQISISFYKKILNIS